jgi:hypothetical protein
MNKEKITDKDKKESYMVTMLKAEIEKRDKRIKELENRTEFTYIEEIKKNFDKALAVAIKENKELTQINIDLKKEIKYHNERVKELRNKVC